MLRAAWLRPRGRTGWTREARQFFGNLPLVAGLAGIGLIIAIALFGPQLAPYDPHAWQTIEFRPGNVMVVPPIPPNRYHWLGTDPMGRDILSRLLWGARLTLTATLLVVVARAALGLLVGLASGWRGGVLDALALHATNALTGFPQLMLALLLVVVLKDWGFLGFVLALTVVGWGELAQFVRREVIRLRTSPYVEAAHALGARSDQVIRNHILRNLAPQLAGLVALEAGAVLLLLAELGFIGFFISGGTFFIDDAGQPVLPIRDRAPEWGQMLAGARYYAYTKQWIAFVPAAVVGAAVLACNLFGEGVRAAIDPFGARRLSPRTLGALGRGLAALTLVGVTGLGVVSVRSGEISFDEGVRRAREAAVRVEPRAELVAAVVRFSSTAHGLGRPQRLNYYFKAPGERAILYVGFPDADGNAADVKRFFDDDGLPTDALQPLGEWRATWQDALASAERRGGTSFRNGSQSYTVQVILEQREGWPAPLWHVAYRKLPTDNPTLDLPVDALSGAAEVSFPLYRLDAEARARQALGSPPTLLGKSATWFSPGYGAVQQAGGPPANPAAAASRTFAFTGEDSRGRGYALVGYNTAAGYVPQGSPRWLPSLRQRPRTVPASPLPDTLPEPAEPLVGEWELDDVYRLVEESGGRAIREGWEREGGRQWNVFVRQYMQDGRPVAEASYFLRDRNQEVRFHVNLANAQVTRLP